MMNDTKPLVFEPMDSIKWRLFIAAIDQMEKNKPKWSLTDDLKSLTMHLKWTAYFIFDPTNEMYFLEIIYPRKCSEDGFNYAVPIIPAPDPEKYFVYQHATRPHTYFFHWKEHLLDYLNSVQLYVSSLSFGLHNTK